MCNIPQGKKHTLRFSMHVLVNIPKENRFAKQSGWRILLEFGDFFGLFKVTLAILNVQYFLKK
jgi:hypothetical protein